MKFPNLCRGPRNPGSSYCEGVRLASHSIFRFHTYPAVPTNLWLPHLIALLGFIHTPQYICFNNSFFLSFPRLQHIVTCIGPNQKNQPNLDLYLVQSYKTCHFHIVVSYLCIGQNQKNQPNLILYLVRRSKIFV